MSTADDRLKIAASIVDFEARRDRNGHLRVYNLLPDDGGGKYEVAGINERFHPVEAAHLRHLVENGRFDEAEQFAQEYIASFTDVADRWTEHTAVESYLRDCVFNRGPGGAARIYQLALGVRVDGAVGPITMGAAGEVSPEDLLHHLREARERYEREWVKRDESNRYWKGLVNRWNHALTFAQTFLGVAPEGEPGGIAEVPRGVQGAAPVTGGAGVRPTPKEQADGHGSSNPHPKPPIAEFIPSPFHSSRNGTKIENIILHCTEASLKGTIREFTEGDRQVSAHYVIDRDGTIIQMVRDSDVANHARGANRNSIGIEHVGSESDEIAPKQEESSAALIRWLMEQYNIPPSHVYGHDFAPEYDRRNGGTSCPDKLFGSRHNQRTIQDWVAKHV